MISVGKGAFEGCKDLASAEFQTGNKVLSLEQTFKNCSSLGIVKLPDNIKTIGNSTFDYCKSLTTMKVNNTLQYLGQRAFGKCTSFTLLYYNGTKGEWDRVKKPDTSGNDKTDTNKISEWYEGSGNFHVDVLDATTETGHDQIPIKETK